MKRILTQWESKHIAKKFNKNYNADYRYDPKKIYNTRTKKITIEKPSLPKGYKQLSPYNTTKQRISQHLKNLPAAYSQLLRHGTKNAWSKNLSGIKLIYNTKKKKIEAYDTKQSKVLTKKELRGMIKGSKLGQYKSYRKQGIIIKPEVAINENLGVLTGLIENNNLVQQQAKINNLLVSIGNNIKKLTLNLHAYYLDLCNRDERTKDGEVITFSWNHAVIRTISNKNIISDVPLGSLVQTLLSEVKTLISNTQNIASTSDLNRFNKIKNIIEEVIVIGADTGLNGRSVESNYSSMMIKLEQAYSYIKPFVPVDAQTHELMQYIRKGLK